MLPPFLFLTRCERFLLAMKHASSTALDRLEPILRELRKRPLKEKSRGAFYCGSRAFLHFHEDGDQFFADVRLKGDDFDRYPATTKVEQAALLKKVDAALK